MDIVKQPTFVLLLADSNFVNLCLNPEESVGRLVDNMTKSRDLCLYTVSGRFGLEKLNNDKLQLTDVEDKNKTSFSQTLENASMIFEEMIVLSNTPEDPYLVAAREVATNNGKTFTIYKYHTKL